MNQNKTTKVFDNGIRMTRASKFKDEELYRFNEADMAGRSMFVTFLDWRTQLIVFLVYGGIGGIVLLAGHEFQSFALFAVGGLINSVYVVFKLAPMLWKWFLSLVD